MVFKNMSAVLKASGCGMNDVVKTMVLLSSMDDFAVVNEIYAQNFQQPFPARSTFAVKTLPKNALVEIEAIAVVPK
jgi:2-iminobutanoate/2-iminopropanoate deaminase